MTATAVHSCCGLGLATAFAFILGMNAVAAERSSTETRGGWVKHPDNPVLGGMLGTCFDVSMLRVDDTYRMYFSWRPKKSLALTESRDGVTWSEPQIVLEPEKTTGWEDDLNRPGVVRGDDGYHLWYTGQANGKSWIGYATSADGKSWKRMSNKPVLSADAPWEKVAVMCPHVIWDTGAKRPAHSSRNTFNGSAA